MNRKLLRCVDEMEAVQPSAVAAEPALPSIGPSSASTTDSRLWKICRRSVTPLLSGVLVMTLAQPAAAPQEILYLSFAAKSRHGFYLRDLNPNDVEIAIDGKPVEIRYFSGERADSAVAILIENSPRTAEYGVSLPQMGQINTVDRIRYFLQGDFFSPLCRGGTVLLAEFFDGVEVLQEFTSEDYLLEEAVLRMQPNFARVLFDQIRIGRVLGAGVDLLRDRREKRKVLLLFTTVVDRESLQHLEEFQGMLLRANIEPLIISFAPRFVSGVGASPEERSNAFFFKSLVKGTGGDAWMTGEFGYLDSLFTELKGRLQNSFTAGFYVHADSAPRERDVEVRLKEKGAEVFHRETVFY